MQPHRVALRGRPGLLARACLLAAAFALAGLPARAQVPRPGGELTAVVQPEPPLLVSAFNSAAPVGLVSTKMLEGLLSYDLEMNPRPALATAWTLSGDGKTLTLRLREGVRWHDGAEFTSADVQFSLMKVWKELHPRGRSTYATVTGVDTPDKHTAVIRLSEPAPALLWALSSYESQVLPRHVYEGTDIRNNPANTAPVGTGPFKFKSWLPGREIVLERNPDYWDSGKPYLERLVFRILPDASARTAAFAAGEVQLGGFSPVPLADLQRLAETGELQIETRGYEYFAPLFLMEFNLRNPYLRDRKVRQAIAHAIDRDRLVREVWHGFGKAAIGPVPSVLSRFYTDKVPQYPFDPARAQRLLDEAGFEKRGKWRFSIIHDYLPYGANYQRTAEAVKQMLEQVGIRVELRSQDIGAFLRRVYGDYEFDLTSNFFYALPDPVLGVQRIYWSKNIHPGVPFSNASGYRSVEMDQLIESIQAEHNEARRLALIHRLQAVAQFDLPVLPPFDMPFFTLANRRIVNHTLPADGLYASFAEVWLKP